MNATASVTGISAYFRWSAPSIVMTVMVHGILPSVLDCPSAVEPQKNTGTKIAKIAVQIFDVICMYKEQTSDAIKQIQVARSVWSLSDPLTKPKTKSVRSNHEKDPEPGTIAAHFVLDFSEFLQL